jgi:hypothetical protein
MVFWISTIARYLLAALVALAMSMAVSLAAAMLLAAPNDDLGIGFLWVSILAIVASVLLPLCLGITAELIERKVMARLFTWSRALLRSLVALPIGFGPLYFLVFVGNRPTHWFENQILIFGLSVVSACFALRIRRQLPRPAQ